MEKFTEEITDNGTIIMKRTPTDYMQMAKEFLQENKELEKENYLLKEQNENLKKIINVFLEASTNAKERIDWLDIDLEF